jgi:predicted peptidase
MRALSRRSIAAVIAGLVSGVLGSCAGPGGRALKYADDRAEEIPYVLRTPPGGAGEGLPLIVFLHGSGECGTDNRRQLAVGLPRVVREGEGDWPCYMLFPQKPTKAAAWEDHEAAVIAMVAQTLAAHPDIDPARVVLTGLSQGGHGSWVIGSRSPDLWAGVAPVCGYARPLTPEQIARGLRDMPVWAFHGERDDVVPAAESRALIEAVRAAGNEGARLTLYPEANHNSWDAAYGDPEVRRWLLTRRR